MNIPFHKAHITQSEIDNVVDTLKSGWITMGPKTIEFENQFGSRVGAAHAVSVNSATAALHLSLKAIGLQAGDEVILPTTTFAATAEVVTYFNAVPVLCDVLDTTHNIDPTKIESLITPKTKAIIPVHFAGTPCDMDAICDIAATHRLAVIEDAAHALPARYNGQPIGTIGDITCFSFYATKTLATGEGGMATTQNEDYANTMKINRLHGISRDAWDRYSAKGKWHYQVVDNGFKYNMTDINAALGLAQLEKLEWMAQQRQAIYDRYQRAFQPYGISTLHIPENCDSAYHLFIIKVDNRDALIDALGQAGVGTSVHFIPIHHHPFYAQTFGYRLEDYPVANRIFDQTVSLPIYPSMTDEQVDYVANKVCELHRITCHA